MTRTLWTVSATALLLPTMEEPVFDHSIASDVRGSSPEPLSKSMKPYSYDCLPSWE